MITKCRTSLFILLALVFSLLPLGHAQDQDQDQNSDAESQEQQNFSEEVPPTAPTPYPIDDDPSIHAEPIDDEGDF